MTDIEEMGPIDWVLIEFDKPLTGEAAPPLLDLVERGLIRILDIMFIRKAADGTVAAVEISDFGDEGVHMEAFVGASSGLLGDEDIDAAGDALESDTRAIMVVYENVWLAPFAVAVRKAGGRLIDQGRIPVQSIVAALDELDELDKLEG